MAEDQVIVAEVPDNALVVERLSPAKWARKNLFNSVMNTMISVVVSVGAAVLLYLGLKWVIGAEFAIVRANLRLFMVGQFPADELWRLWASFYILLLAAGFVSGATAHNASDLATEQGLAAPRATWLELLRRFWVIIAVTIFFISFARTWPPYLALLGAAVLFVLAREGGWAAPRFLRSRSLFIGLALLIISMLVIAGTSRLGGYALALLAFVWLSVEVGRHDPVPGLAGTATRWGVPLLGAVLIFAVTVLIPHDGFGWEEWGGLHITLFTTVVGIALGMPFGIVLALGRRSQLSAVKSSSVLFIEFVRGVPLISLLLFSDLMLPLFLPIDLERPAKLTLAIVVIAGFSAAYIAEIVRGGLQAVPKGQTEAAQAAGMSAGAIQRLIVLPQALRAVIPAMVGQFISLFKDTSLLSIIAILDFTQVASAANAQDDFRGKGLAPVTYLFIAIGYWAFAYTMSKESRRLETKLGVGER